MKNVYDPIQIDIPNILIRSLDQTSWEKVAEGLLYEGSFHSVAWNLKTPEDIRSLYERSLKTWANKKGHPIVFLSPDKSEVYGMTNFMNIEEPHLMLEIGGSWIGKRWQQTFVNATTKYELLKYCFEVLGYRRVEFRIDYENIQSQRAIERLGVPYEGTLRSRRVRPNGESRDYCFYAVTDKDWSSVRNKIEDLLSSYKAPYMAGLKEVIADRRKGQFDQAFEKIQKLIGDFPKEPKLYYHAAWICDAGRTEAEAAQFYEKAFELGISREDRKGAFLGFGSTLRSLGQYEKSKTIFDKALREFPDDRAIKVFAALTEYNLKNHTQAVSEILKQLAATTRDSGIRQYAGALEFYSDKLDEVFD